MPLSVSVLPPGCALPSSRTILAFTGKSHLLCELFSDRRSWSSFLFIPINTLYIFGSIHWALKLMDVNVFICIILTRSPLPSIYRASVNFLFFWFEKNKTLLSRSSNGLFTLAFSSSGRSLRWVFVHSIHFSQACLTELTL